MTEASASWTQSLDARARTQLGDGYAIAHSFLSLVAVYLLYMYYHKERK